LYFCASIMNITKVFSQNNTNDPHLLGRGDIRKLLAQYSLPAIIGMVITSLYHIVDSIFIGHGIGAAALSGMAVTFPIMNILIAFSTLVGVGGATLTSIRLGEKDEEDARSILGHVAVVNSVNGIVLGVVSLIFLDPILKTFGASETLLPYARDFLSVYMMGVPVGYVFIGLNNIMRVTGYPRKAMLSSFLTVAVNVLLAPLFIFVLGWGMKGVALATVLSQLTGLIWVLIHFFDKRSFIRFDVKRFRLSSRTVLNMMAIGVSPFLMNLTASLVVSIINFGLMKHGGDLAVGAYGIINRINYLFGMIVIGLTMGMQPIVGYNYGARQLDRSFKALRYTIVAGTVIMIFGLLCSQIFPHLIMGMFTSDSELLDIAIRGLRITTIFFPVIAVQMVISNFFQSVGKAKIAIFLSLTRQLIFLIPLLLLLPGYFGVDGVFMSMPAADMISFFVTVLTFAYQYRGMRART
jgi:putative MATE family efflux protein